MSIARPNLDNLPRMQAAKRAKKKAELAQLVETALGPSSGHRAPPARAICCPRRARVTPEGLCRWCQEKRLNRAKRDELTPEQALELVSKDGGEALATKVRAKLQTNLEEYVTLHIEAARVAAVRGDSKPAEWALQTIKAGASPVVTPPAKAGEGGGGGIKVFLGVQIGGLPPGVQAQAITIPVDSVTEVPPEDTK